MHFIKDNADAKLRRALAILIVGGLLGGCAAQQYHTDGQRLYREGQTEKGLESLREASRLEPSNLRYRLDYTDRINEEVGKSLRQAEMLRERGDSAGARSAYLAALKLDNSSEQARRGLSEIAMDDRHATVLTEAEKLVAAGKLDLARDRANAVKRENPSNVRAQDLLRQINAQEQSQTRAREASLSAQSIMKKPVTLQFRDANVRMVFEALSRTTGLNVVFDRDVRPDLKTTIFVRDGSVEDTVDLILLQNQLDKKILNANTLFIYPATASKQKEYQELKVRTFHISNGDAKYLQGMLKSTLKIKEVQFDERTNTLVVRDTQEAIAVAAKVIAAHDLPDAEVMLDVAVLEVSRDRITDIGIKWPDGITVSTPLDANGVLTVGGLGRLNRDQLLVTPLQISANLKMQDTDANLLANPRIRVRDREKAKIHIGDKVPVITNAVTPVSTGSAVVTGSIQYIDVGIKLEAEPHVYDEGDVGIKLNLEVSNIVKEITSAGGSLAYQIGTRSATTSLRLRDGETQVLGGLISDADRNTAAKVPGIGQLPILGRLFSDNAGNSTKTEIVLSITPRIVRAKGVAEESTADTWSGTESALRERPLRLDPISTVRSGVGGITSSSAAGLEPSAATTIITATPALSGTTASPAHTSPAPVPGTTSATTSAPAPTPGSGTLSGAAIINAPGKQPDATAPAVAAAALPADPGGAGPELTWSSSGPVKKGDQFSVSVNAASFNGVRAVPVMVQYDPQVLSFVAADLGEFGTRVGAVKSDPVVNQGAGRLNMTLKPAEGQTFKGAGELLKLTFTAKLPRPSTQLSLARVDLQEGTALRTIPRPQPLTLTVEQ